MSSSQTFALPAPRVPVRQARLLTALGVLVAIAASVVILAVNGASTTTVTAPVTSSQALSVAVPQVRYLGPRQLRAAVNDRPAQTAGGGGTSAADARNARLLYCLGAAQRCLR